MDPTDSLYMSLLASTSMHTLWPVTAVNPMLGPIWPQVRHSRLTTDETLMSHTQ